MKRFLGLDFLRFYAALSVVIFHVNLYGEQLLGNLVYTRQPLTRLFINGWDAVTLFFVLSGFLITYLLLLERRTSGTIHVGAFYIRRALRIWPLYFVVLALSLPLVTWLPPISIALIIVFLPNVVETNAPMLLLGHLWSIGAEEQFYLVWPLLLRLPRLSVPKLVLVVVVGKLLLISVCYGLTLRGFGTPFLNGLQSLLDYFRIEAMAFGAFAAWLVQQQHPLLKSIYRRRTQWAILIICAALIALPGDRLPFPLVDPLVALVFSGLVLNVATNPDSLLHLEFRGSRRLGDLSYGMYMYHMLVITVLVVLGMSGVGLYVWACVVTIAVASLSYRYLEHPLSKLKDRIGTPAQVTFQLSRVRRVVPLLAPARRDNFT